DKIQILIATDIAARGIDISELPLVINYELPNIPETYVHRIGRTGRANFEGEAISFCSTEEKKDLLSIQKLIKVKIPVNSINKIIRKKLRKIKTSNYVEKNVKQTITKASR